MGFVFTALIGAIFVAAGFCLPRCRRNRFVGIRIKWTLENEENWTATHRMSGKLWVVGGLAVAACGFLPEAVLPWAVVLGLIVLTAVPVLYSYRYHRKQMREGTAAADPIPGSKATKIILLISLAVLVIVMIFVGATMFTGEIEITCGEDAFTVEASYWKDLTVVYDDVESIEYRDSDSRGVRTFGLGSARLLAGAFRNDEFGRYTRYSYTQCDACVVMQVDGRILVLSGPDAAGTREIYEAIKSNLAV